MQASGQMAPRLPSVLSRSSSDIPTVDAVDGVIPAAAAPAMRRSRYWLPDNVTSCVPFKTFLPFSPVRGFWPVRAGRLFVENLDTKTPAVGV